MTTHNQRNGCIDLRHGDALDVLRTLPDASIDAIVTDPPYELGFMGKKWDGSGIAYSVDLWREALRVLKPGGHLVAFGGTRTYHRMACAVEDAGFEIRDSLHWIMGSGFPKSLDVGAAIMKSQGLAPSEDPWTPEAEQWRGFGSALKPAVEPIVLARKPLSGTVAANVLAHGTGALNIDGTRVRSDDKLVRPSILRTDNEVLGKGLGAGVQDEPAGRWPANVLLTHGPDCGDVCTPGCPVAELDAQAPAVGNNGQAVHPAESRADADTFGTWGRAARPGGAKDKGGASRFFPVFRYQAKAPAKERPKVDGVAHPTVKPLELMRWLVRLVTPPGGTVLDPFAGSGTTLQAAREEGFASIGIEREVTYLPLIAHRLGIDIPAAVEEPELIEVMAEGIEHDPLLAAIADAPDRAALTLLWRANRDTWTAEHQAAVEAALADIEAAA
jgi:hypothetical protein